MRSPTSTSAIYTIRRYMLVSPGPEAASEWIGSTSAVAAAARRTKYFLGFQSYVWERRPLKRDLQAHRLHRQQGLRIALGVIDGIVGVRGLAQVLEVLECVLDQPFVE